MIQQNLCFASLCVKNQAWFLGFCYLYEIICTIYFQQHFSIHISSGLMKLFSFWISDFVAHGHAVRGMLGERGIYPHPRAEVVQYVNFYWENACFKLCTALLRMALCVAGIGISIYLGISILRAVFDFHTLF